MQNNSNKNGPNEGRNQFRPGSDLIPSGRNQEFGKRIKERRKKLSLTQKNLSEITGIDVNTIQNYEAGDFPKGKHPL